MIFLHTTVTIVDDIKVDGFPFLHHLVESKLNRVFLRCILCCLGDGLSSRIVFVLECKSWQPKSSVGFEELIFGGKHQSWRKDKGNPNVLRNPQHKQRKRQNRLTSVWPSRFMANISLRLLVSFGWSSKPTSWLSFSQWRALMPGFRSATISGTCGLKSSI